jgi:diacylglycerol kinase family enzyme
MGKKDGRTGRLAVIHNPVAGRTGLHRLQRWTRPLAEAGFDILDRPAASRAEAEAAARDLARVPGTADAVLAAGGDGTANAVSTGLLGSDLPMAVVPLGTANVLAGELTGPLRPDGLPALLTPANVRRLRPGLANGHPFLLMVSIGLDARAVARIRTPLKRLGGSVAYALSGLEALAAGLSDSCRLSVDGHAPEPVAWAVVARTARHAGGVALGPARSLDFDGLRVLSTRSRKRLAAVRLLATRAIGWEDAAIRQWDAARSVEITGPATEPVQMDGERWGALPLHVRPSERTVRVFVSPDRHPRD